MGVKRESSPSPPPAAAKRPKPEAPQRAKPAAALATDSPFPRLLRPTAQECDVAVRTLRGAHAPTVQIAVQPALTQRIAAIHGDLVIPEPEQPGISGETDGLSVLDQLVATILSQNTTDALSWPAFKRLKAAFPAWDDVRTAEVEDIAAPIRSAGLSAVKSARIKAILQQLHDTRGECTLEHLRGMGDAEAKALLCSFKGVGPKTVACVLMFALRRQEFPVDAHVWKLARSLGWVPDSATREATYAHLNARVPGELKHELHVLLVEHGKVAKNDPAILRAALRQAGAIKAEDEAAMLAEPAVPAA